MMVAGRGSNVVFGFCTDTQIDYSLDFGHTWTVRDLPPPPTGYLGHFQLFMTEAGALLAIHPTADDKAEVLARTLNTSWTHTDIVEPSAPHVPLWLWVHGDVVNAYNPDVTDVTQDGPWWISTDSGAHWRRNDTLPATWPTPAP